MSKLKSFINIILGKKDSRGSVMVTALVAFFFVSVLAVIILSTVTVNFQMRAIDRRTKDEFYYAEKTLNDLYNGLGQDCSQIMGEVYNEVLATYRTTDGGATKYYDEESAYKVFSEKFVSKFYSTIDLNKSTKFPGYIVNDTSKKGDGSEKTSRAKVKSFGNIKYYTKDSIRHSDKTGDVASPATEADKVKIIVIEDVKIQSNPDASQNIGYVSEINTDIVIEIPKISFFNTNNKVFDYAILANDGLILEQNAEVISKGNLYAGTKPFANIIEDIDNGTEYTRTADYGGIFLDSGSKLTIDDAAYVVSGGDITLDGASLNINQSNTMLNNQIWFENLDINGASTVNIKGDLFAADDLQVNSGADGTTVKIEGSYYGYNDGEREMTGSNDAHATTLTTKKALITSNTDYEKSSSLSGSSVQRYNIASRSSAIIMNAKKAKVDMSDLKTLLLLGNSYINHESKKTITKGSMMSNPTMDLIVDYGKLSDASFPESVALKISQDIILMPTDFLKDSNPRICTSGETDPFEGDGLSIPSDWFGSAYVNNTKPYTFVKMDADNSAMIYAYCYLNFKDDASKAAYVKAIIDGDDSGAEPTAASLKSELLERIEAYNGKVDNPEDSDVYVKVGDNDTRVYARGAILTYDGTDLKVTDPSTYTDSNAFSTYSANLYKRYRMLDTYLDNMSDISLSSTGTRTIDNRDFEGTDEELPTGRFFWLWGIRKAARAQQYMDSTSSVHAVKYAIPDVPESSCTEEECMKAERDEFGSNFIFLKSGEVDLCNELSGSNPHKAFVIVDGNATVNEDLTIHGFLVCKGKLTVANGKKLTVVYDSTLFNKRIDNELKKLVENEGYHDENAPNANPEMRNLMIYYLMNGSRKLYDQNGSYYKIPMETNDLENNKEKSPKGGSGGGKVSGMKRNQESDTEVSYREYKYVNGSTSQGSAQMNSDYTTFVYFENWKKGQR